MRLRSNRVFFIAFLAILGACVSSSWAQEKSKEASKTSDDTKAKIESKQDAEAKGDPEAKDAPAPAVEAEEKELLPVDMAILLDTSNSMDGLINQARQQLWQIVERLAQAEKKGRQPFLRVSVFEYGNTNLPATENYIRQVVALTDDLDKVSEALFSLKTQGGDEYCGAVMDEAIKRLDWSKDPDAYRAIFIAGNEPFTQGPVGYQGVCGLAVAKGIFVNTIHCGPKAVGESSGWSTGATLGGGKSFNIDQDQEVVRIKCPQDEVLISLNAELNKTYLWYGEKEKRDSYGSNQKAQDKNSLSGSLNGSFSKGSAPAPGFSARAKSKASGVYNNRARDLVDADEADESLIESIPVGNLPEELQSMTLEQRKARVKEMATRRAELKKKILAVSAERDKFLAAERKKQAALLPKSAGQAPGSGSAGSGSVGSAISESIDAQIGR